MNYSIFCNTGGIIRYKKNGKMFLEDIESKFHLIHNSFVQKKFPSYPSMSPFIELPNMEILSYCKAFLLKVLFFG